MKVLVLGAAGRAARAAVNALRFLPGLERLYLADNNAEALCKLSADLAHLPVSPRYLDAENESSLYERMLEADMVLGCLGPFHQHESRIVSAAIAAGRDYLSLCDDPTAVEEVLARGEEIKKSGIRVLCGCGLTPGLSNLLACRAVSRLDRADSVEFSWFLELGPGIGAATLEHLLHSFAGKAPALQGGEAATARARSWEEVVEFPSPVGRQAVSYLSHPEPATMPATLAGTKEIWFKAGVGGRGTGFALHSLAWLGEHQSTELWQTALHAAAGGIARRGESSCLTAVRITACGMKDGAFARRALCVMGDYYRLSGLVMAASAASLGEEGWKPGAYVPEGVLDSPSTFARLRRAGVRILLGEVREAA